jgi:S-adenosylmethionine decarboxylase
MYQPGLHILATLESRTEEKIECYYLFQDEISKLIEGYKLQNLGEVHHNFSPKGFTSVTCLSESHISVHTWPEYNKINVDIYLSNFKRINDKAVHEIFNALVVFFEATIISKIEIVR